MGNRYGRNQKRKAREQVEQLEKAVGIAKYNQQRAERLCDEARSQAFYDLLNKTGLYQKAVRDLMDAIGAKVGEAVKPHALQMMQAAKPLELTLQTNPMDRMQIVRAHIPAIDFCYTVDIERAK